MSGKLLRTVAFASVMTASSIVMADDGSGIRIVVPMPAPASRPSEADITSVTDAQSVLIIAQKEAADAHAELARAQADLKRLTRQLQGGLETSGDMVVAKDAVVRAKAGYEAATRPVLASLSMDADYRQACAVLTRAQETSAEVSSRGGASFEERVAAGQAVLNAKAAVGRAESAALENDPEVAQAWSRCVTASVHLREVRTQLEQATHKDPSYLAASQAVDEAQGKALAADLELTAAKQDLAAARDRVADKQAARQQVADWARNHGLPQPP